SGGGRSVVSGAARPRPLTCTQAVGLRRWRRRDHDLVEGERGPTPVYYLDHRARSERLLEDYDGRVAELACSVDRADGCTGNREGVPAEQYARGVQADGSCLQDVASSMGTVATRRRGRG